jgi:hypothetical protein
MHDTKTIHFAYRDVSHRNVSSEFLDHIQQAGYRVLYAGVATCPRRGTRRAWVECRKHEPGENGDTDENSKFTPDEARTIVISGPGTAYYTCPRCGYGTESLPPFPSDV